jgi:transposase
MDSVELYRQLLGLTAPWTVERVELDMAKKHVEVHVGHSAGQRFACPECGRELGVYDHLAERVWRHLDSCQFLTYLHARPPRVSCPEHGVHQVSLPWAQPGSRFTNLFEALAIDVLAAANVKKAAEILRITWDEAWHLMERAVLRGRAAKSDAIPKQIGIDEKAIAKGHRYMTLVCDLEESTVEYIGEDRKEASLAAYFDAFPKERREKIEAISLDMWPAYINACRDKVPGADSKMVFDRFHIMRHVLDAVDKVRKREHKGLLQAGDSTLTKSKYLWLTNPANMTEKTKARFDELRGAELKTGRAWALKEALRELWSLHIRGVGRQVLATLVLLGNTQPPAADDRRRQADRSSLAECADLLCPSCHQRCRGRIEFQDRHRPEARLRLSQSEQLQDRRLFPLRRPQPISGCRDPHGSRMNLFCHVVSLSRRVR